MNFNPNDLGKTAETIFWSIVSCIIIVMLIFLIPAAWWTIRHEYTAVNWQELKEAGNAFLIAFVVVFVVGMEMMGGMRR